MTLTVEQGHGYVSAERNKVSAMPIGVIPMDAIFTPMRKVNYAVEDTRVGQITDYDKLVMEVWTNGSVSPEEAISMAAKILVGQLDIFARLTEQPLEQEDEATQEDPAGANAEMTIEELDLSVRAFNCLKRRRHQHGERADPEGSGGHDEGPHLGKKSLEEVEQKLALLGLSLRKSEE